MDDLSLQIEELISQNAPDFEIAKLIKNSVKGYLSSLDEMMSVEESVSFEVASFSATATTG